MSTNLFLDSGPLGLITQPQQRSEVIAITRWLNRCLDASAIVLVPAVVYYEIKRELLRARKEAGLGRLDSFLSADPIRYVPLTDEALRFAAELWARSRQAGLPTADFRDVDIDVILAAQIIQFGGSAIIATTNPKHLSQFVTARLWKDIDPDVFRDVSPDPLGSGIH